jgi:hypothetical protein
VVRRTGSSTVAVELVANARTGEYLLLYAVGSVVRARRIDRSGAPLGAGDILVSGPLSATVANARLAVSPSTGGYLATWQQGSGTRTYKFVARRLGRDGRPSNARRVFSGGGALEIAPARSGGWLFAWARDMGLDREVWAVRATADGRTSGDPFRVSRTGPDVLSRKDTTGRAADPALAPLGDGRRFVAAWSSEPVPKQPRQLVTRVIEP